MNLKTLFLLTLLIGISIFYIRKKKAAKDVKELNRLLKVKQKL